MDDIVNSVGSSPDPDASEKIYVGCTPYGFIDWACTPFNFSQQYFWGGGGAGTYYTDPNAALANGINTASGGFGSLQSIGEFYGASLAGAMGAVGATDIAAGADESVLFGRAYNSGWTGYLNGNSPWGAAFRIGFGWDGVQQVFRIGGTLIDGFLESGHIDLWPPSAW